MEKAQVVEALARVSTLAQRITESEKNSNDLVDLIEYLDCDNQPSLIRAVADALGNVYLRLVTKHYSWIVPTSARGAGTLKPPTEKGVDAVTARYQDWMRDNYVACVEKLQELTYHKNKDVQWTSLCSLMLLVQAEGQAHQSFHNEYIYPNTLFHSVVSCLLDNDMSRCDLIELFSETYLVCYEDVRYYWLKNVASIISAKIDSIRSVKLGDEFIKNCHAALKAVDMPSKEDDIEEFLSGTPPARQQEKEEEEMNPPKAKRSKRELKALSVRSLQKHRKQFSDAWLTFLRLPLSQSLRKRVLVSLHSEVIPHLMDPRLLLDFLTYSYDEGGVVGLLALNGLFLLINQHHLDYPDFYDKLYQLLEPSVFHVKYMQRFFHLLDTFLRSTHLPLYMVAAFAKKIARLSLSAPPNGVAVGVVCVSNLIKRHPNCKVLLHRKGGEHTLSTDTFDLSEPNPAKCGALESSLWELKTLQSHYCPVVSKLLKQLLDPAHTHSKSETQLGKYLDMDNEQLFDESCTDLNTASDIPLNFKEPTRLWTENALF